MLLLLSLSSVALATTMHAIPPQRSERDEIA
jgi:hypothetical protein